MILILYPSHFANHPYSRYVRSDQLNFWCWLQTKSQLNLFSCKYFVSPLFSSPNVVYLLYSLNTSWNSARYIIILFGMDFSGRSGHCGVPRNKSFYISRAVCYLYSIQNRHIFELAWPIQPISRFLPKRVGWQYPEQWSPQKNTRVGFQFIFHNVLLHYQHEISKIVDLLCPVIFLDFCKVCPNET